MFLALIVSIFTEGASFVNVIDAQAKIKLVRFVPFQWLKQASNLSSN